MPINEPVNPKSTKRTINYFLIQNNNMFIRKRMGPKENSTTRHLDFWVIGRMAPPSQKHHYNHFKTHNHNQLHNPHLPNNIFATFWNILGCCNRVNKMLRNTYSLLWKWKSLSHNITWQTGEVSTGGSSHLTNSTALGDRPNYLPDTCLSTNLPLHWNSLSCLSHIRWEAKLRPTGLE